MAKDMYKVERAIKPTDVPVCAFCGKALSEKEKLVMRKMRRFPDIALLLAEIERNRGVSDICWDHSKVILTKVLKVKKLKTKVKFIPRRQVIKKMIRRMQYYRLLQLSRDDAIDRLYEGYERQARPKRKMPKKIGVNEFVALVESVKTIEERKIAIVSLDEFVRYVQKPPSRRAPCWHNPPVEKCTYADSCSKRDICGTGLAEIFAEEAPPRRKLPPHMVQAIDWEWDPCGRGCLICDPNCQFIQNLKLKVVKIRSRRKPYAMKMRKAISKRWRFLGFEGRPVSPDGKIEIITKQDYDEEEWEEYWDAGEAPKE